MLPSPRYAFFTRWHLAAPLHEVAAVIEDPTLWPSFWPSVSRAFRLSPPGPDGTGERFRILWRAPFGYELGFDTETTRREAGRLYDSVTEGDLRGRGRFVLQPTAEGTEVHYHWHVATRPQWMRAWAPVARPVFDWNHDQIMTAGGLGLARHLGARLIAQEHLSGPQALARWPDAEPPIPDEVLPERMSEVVSLSPGPIPEGDRVLQRWEDLCFLHWRVEPAVLRELLASGLEPQLFDGSAWVSLVALRTTRLTAPRRGEWVRRPFAQLNLRTYVTHAGRPGAHFLGVQCGHWLLAKAVKRLAHLPYAAADVRYEPDTEGWMMDARGPLGDCAFRWSWAGAPARTSDPLAEQYASFNGERGLYRGDLAHAPWRVGAATALIAENTVLERAGLGHLDALEPDRVSASPGIVAVTSGPVRV